MYHIISLTKAHVVLYTSLSQSLISFAGYWNDPNQYTSYLRNVKFLPVLNNKVGHPNRSKWRENFLKIRNMILLASPQGIVFL
jgi:hypothetical protein